jgi:tRNA(fMet)-specific endonuclease VapC
MTQFILDTDHVTAFQHGNPRFLQRMKLVDSSRIFVTIITLEEQIKGCFKVINNHNNNPQELPLAYYELHKTFS